MFGFLNIYKPEGMTSFDVVAVLRKITHIKQIGHTGTLDPFAVGVLPICIGKTTKLIEYLPDDKAYIATIKFGCDTDTYDKDGIIVKEYLKKISADDLTNILNNFQGEIEQIPPIYSAIKVNGKKLYEYARNGQSVEIKPRKVVISKIKLRNFDYESQIAKIEVECSKGTYIRSIAYDIGQKLACGGHLIALERTKAGMFDLTDAMKLEEIKTVEDVEKSLINPLNVLSAERYNLDDKEKDKVFHGMPIKYLNNNGSNQQGQDVVFLVYSGRMVGVGLKENGMIKIKKVFEVL